MTAYVVGDVININNSAGTPQSGSIAFTLTSTSYELKIARFDYGIVDFTGTNTTQDGLLSPQMYRYVGGTVSGGTTKTPLAFRQGSPAATATSKMGTGISVTGTSTFLADLQSVTQGYTSGPLTTSTNFPYDLTVSAGSVLVIPITWTLVGNQGMDVQLAIYYEELRLAWHY